MKLLYDKLASRILQGQLENKKIIEGKQYADVKNVPGLYFAVVYKSEVPAFEIHQEIKQSKEGL